jgi:L-threonylcarbamoyladenylate synthase
MTDVLATTEDGIAKGAALLQAGELVAFPTDTVYGVGVAASRPDRLASIFDLKNRPLDKRIPILVSDLSQVDRYEVDDRARALAARFWPGALTLILRGADESQAFRAPDHPVALALIRAAGPLLVTSANRSNEPDTLGADEVRIAFARQQDELAAVLDGGSVPGGVASTVADLSVTPARLLREGPISRAELAEVVELAR